MRQDYLAWIADHATIKQQVTENQIPQATQTSVGQSDPAFLQLTQDTNTMRAIARAKFDEIWQRVYTISLANQALALLFPLAGIVAAWGSGSGGGSYSSHRLSPSYHKGHKSTEFP